MSLPSFRIIIRNGTPYSFFRIVSIVIRSGTPYFFSRIVIRCKTSLLSSCPIVWSRASLLSHRIFIRCGAPYSSSGVSFRTIQQYEQRQKDINKAQAETLLRLSRSLFCNMEDLLEKIARAGAPRCCKRDARIAVREATPWFSRALGVELSLPDTEPLCTVSGQNTACIGEACPYYA